jgi:AraC-like DNA-binding protein
MMNSKLNLPFEFYFLPAEGTEFLKAGTVITGVDMYGLFLCTQGSMTISFSSRCHTLKRHSLYFYTPTAYTHIEEVSDDFKGVMLRADADFVMPLANRLLDVQSQIYIYNHPLLDITEEQSDYLMTLLMTMYERMKQENACGDIDPGRRAVLTELIKSMATTISYEMVNISFMNRPADTGTPDHHDVVLQKFLVSLTTHFRQQRGVAFYAGEQCLSYSYFSDIVKQKTGRTALRWIVELVLADAKQMLEYTDYSVKEIAERLNFPTQSFFGKYFKQYAGLSPKAYRAQARQKNASPTERQWDVKASEILGGAPVQ